MQHLDAVEADVARFLADKDFDSLGFQQVRKAMAAVDKHLEHTADTGNGEGYYELSRVKAVLDEVRPMEKRIEDILELANEVKLPFKVDSAVNAFTVRLLDCELPGKVGQLLGNLVEGGRKPSDGGQKGLGKGIFDEELEDDEPKVRKRGFSGLARPLGGLLTASHRDLGRVSVSKKIESDPCDMKKPSFPEIARRSGCDSLQRKSSGLTPLTIDPKFSESVYHKNDTPVSTAKSHYFRTLVPGVAVQATTQPSERESSEQRRKPPSALARGVVSSSIAQTIVERKSSVGEPKRFPKYYSSVITLNEDNGVIKNLVIDEIKFKLILGSLKCVPKNVKVVEMVNNIFKCNPVPLLRNAFEGKLSYTLKVDMSKNQAMANMVFTKRDVEMMGLYNIVFNA